MALVFAGFTPHTPLITSNIGKEHKSILQKTETSFQYLQNEIYASKPDTVMIISAHGDLLPEAFTLNLHPKFTVTLKEFGDLITKKNFSSDVGFTHHLKEALETKIPVTMISTESLDHGVGVPLLKLLEPFGKNPPKIVPVMYSMLNFGEHYSFGIYMQQHILNSTKRIAVVASGELSHRLTKKSPAGYSPRGAEFDEQVKNLVSKGKLNLLPKLNTSLVEEAGECGFRSLLILAGILNSMNYTPEVLSYEAPFGIGYLVANFKLS
ncbi:MAG: class III extradiol dioxygenase subunit B-like domain-containing protein [Patescibacteria group bacterium]|jgi:aromatic ring-opening dioxygenase LigB subunit